MMLKNKKQNSASFTIYFEGLTFGGRNIYCSAACCLYVKNNNSLSTQ